MKKVLLCFGTYENKTPSGKDGVVILFNFSMVNPGLVGLPEESVKTESKSMTVSISRTQIETWGYEGDALVLILFEIGRRAIVELLRNRGQLSDDELIIVQQSRICPFDPKKIEQPYGFKAIVELPDKLGFI